MQRTAKSDRPDAAGDKTPEEDPAVDKEADESVTLTGGAPVMRATNRAMENWLQLHLRQLYEEVCSEPLPSELNDMIDRFRRHRQEGESGRDACTPLTPARPARQGS